MPLTPLDIEARKFRRETFGYRKSEVESFLRETADALARAILEKEEMARLMSATRAEIEEHRAREQMLLDAIASAERIARAEKARAQEEAERIIADGRRQAERLISSTQAELVRVEQQIVRLRVERESFESRLGSLVDEHRRLLEIRRQEVGVAEQLRARTTRPPEERLSSVTGSGAAPAGAEEIRFASDAPVPPDAPSNGPRDDEPAPR